MNTKKYHCVLCGSISGKPFCNHCMDKAREYFETISDYIKSHHKVTVIDVYAATSIPFAIIKALLELGWIDLVYEAEGIKIKQP